MVDNAVDYTGNSFNKSDASDPRFNVQNPNSKRFYASPRPKSCGNTIDCGNFVLQDTPSMNDADADDIYDRNIYRSKIGPTSLDKMAYIAKNNPELILNDPALKRAAATDPTVRNALDNNPIVIKQPDNLLINMGNDNRFNPDNSQTIYEQYLDGNLDLESSKLAELKPGTFMVRSGGPVATTSDPFWLEQPSILFWPDKYYQIFPNKNMSRMEILNALTRFFIYLAILCVLFVNQTEYLFIPFIGIIICLLLYIIQKNDKKSVVEDSVCRASNCNQIDQCQRPTTGNPFMNVTMAELMDNRDRSAACMATDKQINNEINENFQYNYFKDVDDVFDRQYNQRQFYTMPSTTIPNNQGAFARWLYKLPETCKENQLNCLKYEDVRFNRFNPNTDRMERIKEDII